MPFFDKYNVLYVHIPKTGGWTIYDIFDFPQTIAHIHEIEKNDSIEMKRKYKELTEKHLYGYERKITIDDIDRLFEPSHYTMQVINQIYGERFNNSYKFCFVRNPYDKIVSRYHFNDNRLMNKTNLTFDEFVLALYHKYLANYDNMDHNVISHFMSQYDYCFDNNGVKIVDDIYKFENFEEDMLTIMLKFNIHKEIPHHNQTTHDHWSKYFTNPVTEAIIYCIYKKDFDVFGYERFIIK
jgi:hypothetical protein